MSRTPITLAQIPTVTTLYAQRHLQPSQAHPLTAPSAALNNRVSIFQGDITNLQLDAIVNAANSIMLGGGGIDGAIHKAAGPGLRAECATYPPGPNGRCPTGECKITAGHNLPAKYVIHAVGPDCNAQRDMAINKQLLTSVYDNILNTAADNGVATIGMCGISSAIYGYPPLDAALVACERVRRFLESDKGKGMERVIFVTFSKNDVDAYNAILPRWFPQVKNT